MDIVHNDTMKFVLMAFDEGTGLTPHRAPGNAILTALEGTAVIGYEGTDYTLNAGESFRFEKNGLHSVTAKDASKCLCCLFWNKTGRKKSRKALLLQRKMTRYISSNV